MWLSTIQKWGTCKSELHSCVLFLLYMYIITAIVQEGDKGIKSKSRYSEMGSYTTTIRSFAVDLYS